jgi:N-acetyl-gamma-glutamyl-phosphate reductase
MRITANMTKKVDAPMLNTLIVGASGYAGAELVTYVNRHPHMNITALTVSAQSNDAGKLISDLHPQLKGIVDLPLQPMSDISEFTLAWTWCFWPPRTK